MEKQKSDKQILKKLFLLMPVLDLVIIFTALLSVAVVVGVSLFLFIVTSIGSDFYLFGLGVKEIFKSNISDGIGYIGLVLVGLLICEIAFYLLRAVVIAVKYAFFFCKDFIKSTKTPMKKRSEKQIVARKHVIRVTVIVAIVAAVCLVASGLTGSSGRLAQFMTDTFNTTNVVQFFKNMVGK